MCYPTTSETSDNTSIIVQCVHDPFENTHVNDTTDIVDTSLPTLITSRCEALETDEQKLIELGKKHIAQTQLQRQRAYQYYLRVKDSPDYKEKVKLRKHEYYINNKELLRVKERFRYQNNVEYHDRVRARARELYKEHTKDIPKQKRGRKPKPKDEASGETTPPKPKGRPPKTKVNDNTSTNDLINSN